MKAQHLIRTQGPAVTGLGAPVYLGAGAGVTPARHSTDTPPSAARFDGGGGEVTQMVEVLNDRLSTLAQAACDLQCHLAAVLSQAPTPGEAGEDGTGACSPLGVVLEGLVKRVVGITEHLGTIQQRVAL
jgi:hypothetical protein